MTVRSQDNADSSISTAITHLETEQSRLADEKAAFKRFSRRVEKITPDSVAPTKTMIGYKHQSSTKTLSAIREAYSETVMDVSHYEEDYNDTYQESIAEEFGPEFAVLLSQSDQFSPGMKSNLLVEIDEAITQRNEFQNIVEQELCSLRTAATEIRSVSETITRLSGADFDSATFGALDAYLQQTDVLIANCDDIARTRQDDLAAIQRSWQSAASIRDVLAYFYQSFPVTYPVLARLGEIGETIVDIREEIEAATMYCSDQ